MNGLLVVSVPAQSLLHLPRLLYYYQVWEDQYNNIIQRDSVNQGLYELIHRYCNKI